MKRSGLIAISLMLIMLLLVLGAAFVFLYQGRPVLERRVDALTSESAALRQELALAEATVMVSEATRLAAGAALATAESAAVLLEGQLVASQQEADTLATRVIELTGGSETSTDSRPEPTATATPGPPQVAIVAPADGAVLAAGAAVNIVVAAADVAGITAVNLTIDDEAFRSYSVEDALLFTVSENWTPAGAGAFTLGAIAVNSYGLASETITTTITISPTAQTPLSSEIGGWRLVNFQSPISNPSLPPQHQQYQR